MAKTKERLNLTDTGLSVVINTLTLERMYRYLNTAKNDKRVAMSLYMYNAKISAAMLSDIHFLEVALRNKFSAVLSAHFVNNGLPWYDDPAFQAIVSQPKNGRPNTRTIKAITGAQKSILKNLPINATITPGKLVAELTFGFWHTLANPDLEHTLWVPVLSKCFGTKAPQRATFNAQLETIRQIRNRVAHHEPIIHLTLEQKHKDLIDATTLLCPSTVQLLKDTSTVKNELKALNTYKRRKNL